MARRTHQYTIADDEAVRVLLDKLLIGGPHQQRREKLLKALDDASQRYNSSTQKGAEGKERKAFFHGSLTGYAVVLKLW
jgi:hypothetical protein